NTGSLVDPSIYKGVKAFTRKLRQHFARYSEAKFVVWFGFYFYRNLHFVALQTDMLQQ
ncbi:hypothetical protein Ancab_020414, partial [Ancistrocladus abbreviatus]